MKPGLFTNVLMIASAVLALQGCAKWELMNKADDAGHEVAWKLWTHEGAKPIHQKWVAIDGGETAKVFPEEVEEEGGVKEFRKACEETRSQCRIEFWKDGNGEVSSINLYAIPKIDKPLAPKTNWGLLGL